MAETPAWLYPVFGGAAVLLVGYVSMGRFPTHPTPPPPPPAPPAPETSVTQTLRFTEGFYKASLADDARAYQAPTPTLEEMAAPLRHTVELQTPRRLAPGKSIDTPSLRLTAKVVKTWAKSGSGQGFRFDHLVLDVTNKRDRAVAWRVDTFVDHPERCRSKGSLPHNAMALAAGETTERTECLFHRGMALVVKRVETVTLPPLGYYYVSRLVPSQIGLDERTSGGHTPPPVARPCAFIPWREIESARATWADVIDFYARHNCDEYAFYGGYTFRTAPGPLPAHSVAAPSPPSPPAAPRP